MAARSRPFRVAPCTYCGRFAVVVEVGGGTSSDSVGGQPASMPAPLAVGSLRPHDLLRRLREHRHAPPPQADASDATAAPAAAAAGAAPAPSATSATPQPDIDFAVNTVHCAWPDCPGTASDPPTPVRRRPDEARGQRPARASADDGDDPLADLAKRYVARSPECWTCHRRVPVPYWCTATVPETAWDAAPSATSSKTTKKRSGGEANDLASSSSTVEFRCEWLPRTFPRRDEIVASCAAAAASGSSATAASGKKAAVAADSVVPLGKLERAVPMASRRRAVAKDSEGKPLSWERRTMVAQRAATVYTAPAAILEALGLAQAQRQESRTKPATGPAKNAASVGASATAAAADGPSASGTSKRQKAGRVQPTAKAATDGRDTVTSQTPPLQRSPVTQQAASLPAVDASRPDPTTTTPKLGQGDDEDGHRPDTRDDVVGGDDESRQGGDERAEDDEDDERAEDDEDDEDVTTLQQWARCNLCEAWRVVPRAVDPEQTWVCADLDDGTLCEAKGVLGCQRKARKSAQRRAAPGRGGQKKKTHRAEGDGGSATAADDGTHRSDGKRVGLCGAEALFTAGAFSSLL